MNELALFAGAGGGLLGTTLLGWQPVCAVEKDPYRREVLLRRQRDRMLPLFPVWDDVLNFEGREWRGSVDIITAGFPCQPHSVAGKRKGAADERNLWPATARILGEVRPRFALLENVPGLIANGFIGTVLGDLAALGYDARWGVISAADAGAPHRRKRVWIVANANERQWDESGQKIQTGRLATGDSSENVADAAKTRCSKGRPQAGWEVWDKARRSKPERLGGDVADADEPGPQGRIAGPSSSSVPDTHGESSVGTSVSRSECSYWFVEPDVGRVANGVAARVDRLGALGDGQVPAVVRLAWEILAP